ncbi:MAG: protein translocase subunit SecD [Candidatus Dependentiae bacterium]|nr:protein translocase subunit SecD [Candidatus Dependentiae bacterium]
MTESLRRVSLNKIFLSRLSLWIVLAVAGGWFVYNINKYIKFGIDLVGGTYITLEVQLDKAHETELIERAQEASDILKKAGRVAPKSIDADGKAAVATLLFPEVKDASAAAEALHGNVHGVSVDQIENKVFLRLSQEQIRQLDREAVESNINALNSRMNQFGVSEILIARRGERRIVVELPNVHNFQQAKAMIGKAAMLEFKLVEDVADSEQRLLERYGGELPEGTMIVPGKASMHREGREYYLLPKYTDITGKLLKTAYSAVGGNTGVEPVVAFEFKREGADKFYELTSNNMGRRLAVVVDGVVISAPEIHAAIGASGTIQGAFTATDAQDLAMMLRSGAFVAPVTFEEERHMEASLGKDSIHKGVVACAVGLALLLLFCVLIYKVAGLLAFIVLLFNLCLVLVCLWLLGATLTLPGIAGMVLAIGMAIDASVLIYERMRDELAAGVPLRKAIDAGFSGSMAVIIDSNLTALIAAIVLYRFGTGPIRGFAVTQIVGVVATIVTGLWLLKSMLTYLTDVIGVTKIKI